MWNRSEVRGQRSEARGQRPEVGGRRSEVGGRRSERKKGRREEGKRGRREEGKRGRGGGFIGFSELGAGCSKDGLGQDVPATMKKRAGRPRSL
jgi:hypothetical protein